LAAQGLTNVQIARALFLSAKTVDHHLSRTYAKLGIGSRRELALAWQTRDLSTGLARNQMDASGTPVPAPPSS
jgi:DNA-binding NarL/FixJ family response regulator